MNRIEFMNRLEGLLAGIPQEEKREALQYYADYFEDAGDENEHQVMSELGSPEKVAATIKADIRGNGSDGSQFTEQGYTDTRFEQKESPVTREDTYKKRDTGYTYNSTQKGGYESGAFQDDINEGQQQGGNIGKVILVIMLILLAAPVVIPISIGVIVLVIMAAFGIFGLFAGLLLGSVILAGAGFFIFIFGLTKLMVFLPVALVTSGAGLLLFVVGLVATVVTFKLCTVVYPAICRGIINICRRPFHRRAV